ncbi:MAG TPA: hypothetical protein VNO55_18735 [Polyangia bacterium]|nr:hypothetical protein [Polyangia bacterium]
MSRPEGHGPEGDTILRWRESSGDPRAASARAADLVDAVRDVAPLAPETLLRIRGRVLVRRSFGFGRGLPLVLRLGAAALVVLASVATAKGTMVLWRRYVAAPLVVPLPPPARPPRAVKHASPGVVPIAAPVLAPIAVEAPPVEVAPEPAAAPTAEKPAHVAHPRRMALASPAGPAPGSQTEAQLLAGALSRLRQAHDPRGALALLDQYTRTYPHGLLQSEALSARLEAVIKLDDRKTALRLLDGRATFVGRLGADLLLTRAELRASAGRYTDAVADFDRLLATPAALPSAEGERALYGRAVSLGHLGRDDRARDDLAAYQQRFPAGKYSAEVARLLKGTAAQGRP